MPDPFDPHPAAALIAEARRGVLKLRALPEAWRPRSLAEGYAVQEAAAERLGPRAGWKIAATNVAAQAALGASAPVAGRMPRSVVGDSPARFERRFATPQIECEFAFLLGERLGVGGPPTLDRVAGAVEAVLPAFEIVDPVFLDRRLAGLPSLVAASTVAGCVLGPATLDWRHLDLAAVEAVLEVDGAAAASGRGASVLGHPLEALLWLATHLQERGLTLEAGEVAITGSCTGLTPVGAGATARASFGPLGVVEATIGALAETLEPAA
jgi:2-keto-4-pentenoate hydratase